MPGFPGIFICVHGSELGMITDTRDMTNAPTVNNLLKKSCKELKQLWKTALTEQMKVLKKEEGEDAVTLPYLEHELKLAEEFDATKEEKMYQKNKQVPFSFSLCC